MNGSGPTEEKKVLPPYNLPWRTFLTALDHLHNAVPDHLDKSAFPTLAGGVRTYVISALRFFRLIDGEDDASTDTLRKLANLESTELLPKLRPVIEAAYRPLLDAVDLEKTTPQRFRDVFNQTMGVSGETSEKCQRFFLSAAKAVGIPLTKLLEKKTRRAVGGGARRQTKPKQKREKGTNAGQERTSLPPPESGWEKTVRIGEAGHISVRLDVNPFDLRGKSRESFFALVDLLDQIAGENPESAD
jgi:hypothetical protein